MTENEEYMNNMIRPPSPPTDIPSDGMNVAKNMVRLEDVETTKLIFIPTPWRNMATSSPREHLVKTDDMHGNVAFTPPAAIRVKVPFYWAHSPPLPGGGHCRKRRNRPVDTRALDAPHVAQACVLGRG